jgi:hypothetical protein
MAESRKTDAGELMRLYKDLKNLAAEGKDGKALDDMTADELRAYKTASKRRSRERQRAAVAKGSPEPSADNVRLALADAALLILAANGPGSDAIMRVLSIAFAGRAGVPGRVRADAQKGKLRPRMIVIDPPASDEDDTAS